MPECSTAPYTTTASQARSQTCEIGGGANNESGGEAGRAPKARGSRVGFGEGVSPFPIGRGLGRGLCLLPRNFFNVLYRYAAFWVQSDAFSDIGLTRPVPNSLHSQPAESSDIIKPASVTLGKGCRAF